MRWPASGGCVFLASLLVLRAECTLEQEGLSTNLDEDERDCGTACDELAVEVDLLQSSLLQAAVRLMSGPPSLPPAVVAGLEAPTELMLLPESADNPASAMQQLDKERASLLQDRQNLENAADSARLQDENKRLQLMSQEIREEGMHLQRALNLSGVRLNSVVMQRQEAVKRLVALRDENVILRQQTSELRREFVAASASAAMSRRLEAIAATKNKAPRATLGLCVLLCILAAIVSFCCVFQFGDYVHSRFQGTTHSSVQQKEEESLHLFRRHRRSQQTSDQEEEWLKELEGHPECCGCPSLCCSWPVLLFCLVALIATVMGAVVLWRVGLLQGILAQVSVYAYLVILLGAFLAIILIEFWRLLGRLVKYIVHELRTLKALFRVDLVRPGM